MEMEMTSEILSTVLSLECFRIVAGIISLLIFIGFILSIFEGRSPKTSKYRAVVTDMYVAGTIRKLAKEDNVDLDLEYKNFKKWDRKDKHLGRDLDNAVESELKDKIAAKNEAAIESISEGKSTDDKGSDEYLNLAK